MTYIGIMGAGIVPSPISPAATPSELANILRLAQSKAVVVHPTLKSLLQEALLIAGGDVPAPLLLLMEDDGSGAPSVQGAVAAGAKASKPFEPLRKPAKDTLALVPYSS